MERRIDLRTRIEDGAARGGVISRRDLMAKLGRLKTGRVGRGDLSYGLSHRGRLHNRDTEAFADPVTRQGTIAAVETLMNALKGRSIRSAV